MSLAIDVNLPPLPCPPLPDKCGVRQCEHRVTSTWDTRVGRWSCRCQVLGATKFGSFRRSWHCAWWDEATGAWHWSSRGFPATGLTVLDNESNDVAEGGHRSMGGRLSSQAEGQGAEVVPEKALCKRRRSQQDVRARGEQRDYHTHRLTTSHLPNEVKSRSLPLESEIIQQVQYSSVMLEHDCPAGSVDVVVGPQIKWGASMVSRWWGDSLPRPSKLHIDPERCGFCVVHALRNVMQDQTGHLITDSLMMRGAQVAAQRLGESVSKHCDMDKGGNFSISAMMEVVGLLHNFSMRLLSGRMHLGHHTSAEEFAMAAFADVESSTVIGLVIHSKERHHYVALLRNGDHFPPEMLLLDALRPSTVEIVTADSFRSSVASGSADGVHEQYIAQPAYTMFQCLNGKLRE